ncbi:MAG: heterocyst frequency control protein PatD [Cyanobacteria bacterium P01_A01_bin.123]
MLSPDNQRIFTEFANQLDRITQMATQANPDCAALQGVFLTYQQQFQQQIMPLQPEGLAVEASQQLQRCQTEMNRLMRLLGNDVSFLRAARQTATQQQRQAQIRQRIEQLKGLCQLVLPA